jgi:iron complex transport system substrate-binding protein
VRVKGFDFLSPVLLLRRPGVLFMKIKVKIITFYFLLFAFHFSLFTSAFAEAPDRIISLAPSVTEILFAAGLGDRVVGVTTFCDYPEEARKRPKIGGMSNPSLEAVVRLKPDIVVMTTDGNPEDFRDRLRELKIRTYVFTERRLSELPDGIRRMGVALNAEDDFNVLAERIEKALSSFKKEKILSGEKVVFIIWPEPLIVAGPGTAISDAISLLGGINIADTAEVRYPKYSIEELIRRSPDIIFIGKGHEDMKVLSERLLKRLGSVRAVKNGKVFYVGDGLYRLGPRVIEGIEEMVKLFKQFK